MAQQKKDLRKTFAETVANELIEQLKQGTAPFQQRWEPAMGSDLPYNATTLERYSGGNTLLLMLANRADPRWMTYKQAQSIGAQVRRGEKGVGLLKLITHFPRTVKDEQGRVVKDEQGRPLKEIVKLGEPMLKSFTVFNAEQIDGLPPLQREPVWENHQRAEQLLTLSGADIRHQSGDRAYFYPAEDYIVLPHKQQFDSAAAYYSIALHELGHWTGHESRLNRELVGYFQDPVKYAKEELRAEISSMITSRELGVPFDPKRHADYVGSWIQELENDPTEILKAARDAEKIQQYLLSFERTVQQEPAADKVVSTQPETSPVPDPHYSENIINHLVEQHGWHKRDALSASKDFGGAPGDGMLNPEGSQVLYARFNESGRYLAIERGWETLFDLDARDKNTDIVADVTEQFAKAAARGQKTDRQEIEMTLYGRQSHASAGLSPEYAQEVAEALPHPAQQSLSEFSERAKVMPEQTHWQVIWPEATEAGVGRAVSDAATEAEAIRDVHYRQVEAYLSRLTDDGKPIPNEAVLADYPDLKERYLPDREVVTDTLSIAEDGQQPAGSKRLAILQRSLEKKQAEFDRRLQDHFDDARSTNGQPLNDKRNGQDTLRRWDRQNDGLRSLQESITKTEAAIQREQAALDRVAGTELPACLKPLLESGELIQWRKYPNRFFVSGVDKARIVWHADTQEFGYAHIQGMPQEQRARFKEVYDRVRRLHQEELTKAAETAQPNKQEAEATPESRFETAKDRYLMQSTFLLPQEKQQRQVMEYLMEKSIEGLPPDVQMQARTNFYETQLSAAVKEPAKALDEPGLDFNR
ncbi:MAG: zincin-like metallopeptidase domain-containing protein [Neisseria sp.]|uniref:ArdC family protein n=1 Tax=Neisseria sp. TaxID=192066 RepID=UPI0026DC2FC1|nr:zincin-like metallopeptidase domain-containing protein [Neisseria sp.]MDO4641708.1 zincin-like metallopeptidase domain-containing protein [Neisseria sp.]